MYTILYLTKDLYVCHFVLYGIFICTTSHFTEVLYVCHFVEDGRYTCIYIPLVIQIVNYDLNIFIHGSLLIIMSTFTAFYGNAFHDKQLLTTRQLVAENNPTQSVD